MLTTGTVKLNNPLDRPLTTPMDLTHLSAPDTPLAIIGLGYVGLPLAVEIDELWGEVFEPLTDATLFATARQDEVLGTVVWANGADLAPEFLLKLLQEQTSQAA